MPAALRSPIIAVRRTLMVGFLAVFAAWFAGCATSEFRYTKKISTGERLEFQMIRGRVVDASGGGLTARMPILVPNQEEKKVGLVFGLSVTDGGTLRHVRVEDVSDEQPLLILEDAKPELKENLWIGRSEWFTLDDPAASWIKYLGDTFRVYRITATRGDGREVVLHEGSFTQGLTKALARRMAGLEY